MSCPLRKCPCKCNCSIHKCCSWKRWQIEWQSKNTDDKLQKRFLQLSCYHAWNMRKYGKTGKIMTISLRCHSLKRGWVTYSSIKNIVVLHGMIWQKHMTMTCGLSLLYFTNDVSVVLQVFVSTTSAFFPSSLILLTVFRHGKSLFLSARQILVF